MKRNLPVSGIMTRRPAFVAPEDNLERVRQIFEQHGFHHAPVVLHGKLVGIVSYNDYLRCIRDFFGAHHDRSAGQNLLHDTLVEDVMTAHPVCLHPDDTIGTAIQVFRENPFHALPVTEADGKLVGILTTHDVMKIFEDVIAPEFSYNE